MIKLITMVRRIPQISLDEFRNYEESSHVPLVKRIMGDDLFAYVRNYPIETPSTAFRSKIEYDAVIESHFEDRRAFERAIAATNQQQNAERLRRDYTNYLDVKSVRQSLFEVKG